MRSTGQAQVRRERGRQGGREGGEGGMEEGRQEWREGGKEGRKEGGRERESLVCMDDLNGGNYAEYRASAGREGGREGGGEGGVLGVYACWSYDP